MRTLPKKTTLADILAQQGYAKPEDIDEALRAVGGDRQQFGPYLVRAGKLSEDDLAQALAMQYRLRYYALDDFRVPPDFFKTIPVEHMYRVPFVPIEEKSGAVTVVLADPGNLHAIDELELLLKKEMKLAVGTKTAILEALKRSEGSTQVLRKIEADFHPEWLHEDEEGEEVLSVEKISKDQSPVIRLVDTIILNALQKRVSDIHIEATAKNVAVKYRIDGVLYPAMEPLDLKFHSPLITRIKVMAELDIAEKRVPHDGRFKMRLENKTVDFRVSILPSIFGEDVVIRILDKEYITAGIEELRLDRLGFNQEDLRRFRKNIVEPYGMVLVTGPTGSGKTTTLYAALSEINASEDKIITIEDPVEYQLRGVVQIPVNEKKGLTFARGLRSILRHDPDKILVGEIRDAETAQIAIQSALTGHLVFTTVHANNAFDVIGRFTNMGIEPYNFVSSLNCILAQRLVRDICSRCAEEVVYPKEVLEAAGLVEGQYANARFLQGRGCPDCNGTGYRGRRAITEFLDLSDNIREMILERRSPSEIRKAAIAEGMTSLRQAAVEKVLRGETTLKEINRVTFIE